MEHPVLRISRELFPVLLQCLDTYPKNEYIYFNHQNNIRKGLFDFQANNKSWWETVGADVAGFHKTICRKIHVN